MREPSARGRLETIAPVLHEILDLIDVILVATDRDGRVTMINRSGCDRLGFAEDEILGRIWCDEVVPPEDRARVRQALAQLASGTAGAFEYVQNEVVTRDGERLLISWHNAVLKDSDGSITGTLSSGEDITDRRRATKQLRETEDQATRLGRILEDSVNEIYVFDAQTLVFTQVNRGGRSNLGYSAAELGTMTPIDLKPEFTPESFATLLEPLRVGMAAEVNFETVHRRKDGSAYPIEVHLQLFANQIDPVFVAIVLDLTERRQAEEELRWKTWAFEAGLTANSTAGRDGILNHANESFLRLWGYPEKDDVIGRPITDFFVDVSEGEQILGALDSTGEWTGEFEALRRDGSTFVASSIATVIADDAGKVVGYQSAVLDATDKIRAERLLHERRNHLEKQVARRTTDLQKAVDLMAGREIRMAELKEEIQWLRARLESAKESGS